MHRLFINNYTLIDSYQTILPMFQHSSHKLRQTLPQNNDLHPSVEQRLRWEHNHMMKEDYEALFYRKLNLIIMLEQSEQAYHQREILMISHREKTSIQSKTERREDVHPVTFLAKEMVKQNDLIKKEMGLRKKEAELKVQMNKLELDKKCLIEEVKIFASKISDISQEYFQNDSCRDIEQSLIEHAKKYNLTSTIVSFIKQAKAITTQNIVHESLKSSLKRVNINNCKAHLKLEDLRQVNTPSKSKRQLLEHLTLYLKQFRSSTIFKELSEVLHYLIAAYDKINLQCDYLYNKIMEQIELNLTNLSKINKEIEAHNGELKDYKIQIEILAEENKIAAKQIKQLQQACASVIAEEAAYVSRQFGVVQQIRSAEASFIDNHSFEVHHDESSDHFAYFHQQLKHKYQQFIQNQLQDAEHIRILKEKIEGQTISLQRLRGYLHQSDKSPTSELQTHRTNDESIFSQFNCPLKEAEHSNRLQSVRSNYPKEQQSCLQSNFESISSHLQLRKESFVVKKMVNISKSSGRYHHVPKNQDKIYELKLTKKHLIFQQRTNSILRCNQKVAIDKIKGHRTDQNEQIIWFDCGLNCLKLQFVSKNLNAFTGKLDKLYRMAKENRIPSNHPQKQ